MKIAILGSTGNIGGLLTTMFKGRGDTVYPLTRKDTLLDTGYDVIINCVGNAFMGADILNITETYDHMIFSYLLYKPDTIVINFSSGVAGRYGGLYPEATNYYAIAKLNSEAKHRASGYRITDIRLFSSFHSSFKRDKPFFINAVIENLLNKTEHIDNTIDFTRDYISAVDLFTLVCKCIEKGWNECVQAFSLAPTTKYRILEVFNKLFGLKYRMFLCRIPESSTGQKKIYIPSSFSDTHFIGYMPTVSSIDNLVIETKKILAKELNEKGSE